MSKRSQKMTGKEVDAVSIAESTNSKHGVAFDKHCMSPECKQKKITGKNWSEHKKAKHGGLVDFPDPARCIGEGCKACKFLQTIKNFQSKHGQPKQLECVKCHLWKQKQTVNQATGICNMCQSGKQPLKSALAKSVILGKRSTISLFGANDAYQGQNDAPGLEEQKISDGLDSMVLDENKDETLTDHDNFLLVHQPNKRQKVGQLTNPKVYDQSKQSHLKEHHLIHLPMQQQQPVQSTSTIIRQKEIVYVEIGQRDADFIKNLRILEGKDDCDDILEAQNIIEMALAFTQGTVSNYLETGQHSKLINLILLVQGRVGNLDDQQVVAIAYASILLGPVTWSALPAMFSRFNQQRVEMILPSLSPFIGKVFNTELAAWICSNWKHLDKQTFQLLTVLAKQMVPQASTIATISLLVNCTDHVEEFIKFTKVFTEFATASLLLESLEVLPRQSKLQYKQYKKLAFELQKDQNNELLITHRDELLQQELTAWFSHIKQLQTASLIVDVDSIKFTLQALSDKYGAPASNFKVDLLNGGTNSSRILKQIIYQAGITPNNLQAALAQYTVGLLSRYRNLLVRIPAGQGKSIIGGLQALFAVSHNVATTVHLVFSNQHLLERDQARFSKCWTMSSNELRVLYHENIAFNFDKSKDLVIFDEVDSLLYSNPKSFHSVIASGVRCICLTATPDNEDRRGTEKMIVETMGLTRIDYGYEGFEQLPQIDRTVAAYANADLLALIREELKQNTVLLFCDANFYTFLFAENQSYTLIEESVSDKFLAEDLDQSLPSGLFNLLVANKAQFAMRGLDYRAPQRGISLVIAASFENEREAAQGLNRVGRYKDPCSRILIEGVHLVDPDLETVYYKRLLDFLTSHAAAKKIVPSGSSSQLVSSRTIAPVPQANTNKRQVEEEKKACVVRFCSEQGQLWQLSCCKQYIHETCWLNHTKAQTQGLLTGPVNELKPSWTDRKKAPKACPCCRTVVKQLTAEVKGFKYNLFDKMNGKSKPMPNPFKYQWHSPAIEKLTSAIVFNINKLHQALSMSLD